MEANERRNYQRGDHFHIIAKLSHDRNRWKKVSINNLSSGGLQLRTEEKFNVGDKIWFDLEIQGFFSEFETQVEGEIRNIISQEDQNVYGVIFHNLPHDKKIFIDENIKKDRPVAGDPYSFDQ